MPQPPLRAVILDNDETTGSYGILFAIIATLQQIPVSSTFVEGVLQRLATWMIAHHCFRPGLRTLLTVLLTLREKRQIDSIIMYTNQKEQEPELGNPLLLYSVPKCIAYMMNYIMDRQGVFDHILARPANCITEQNGWIQKNFSRVLALYPERPNDIRDMIFVDDMAIPQLIDVNGIPRSNVLPTCWYRVDPYYRILSDREFVACVTYCFGPQDPFENFTPYLWEMYKRYVPQQKASTPNGSVFIHLTDSLIKKYGYASKWLATQNRVPVPSLNVSRNTVQNGSVSAAPGQAPGQDTSNQANLGASEGVIDYFEQIERVRN